MLNSHQTALQKIYGRIRLDGTSIPDDALDYYSLSIILAKELANLVDITVDKWFEQNNEFKQYLTTADYLAIANKHIEKKQAFEKSFGVDKKSIAFEKTLLTAIVNSYFKEKVVSFEMKKMEARFTQVFDSLNKVLYREPNATEKKWLIEQGLSEEIAIYKPQPRIVQANIELKQRTFSFIYAAWLATKTKYSDNKILSEKQKKLFNLFKKICQKIDTAGNNLTDPKFYNTFLSNEIEKKFNEKVIKFLITDLDVSKKQVGHTLHQFECFANWERQAIKPFPANGIAVITKAEKEDKLGYIVRISKPINPPLTVAQQNEFASIKINSIQHPRWFTKLPDFTQKWLQNNVTRIVDGELPCPHSVLRFIPGLANVIEDQVYFIDKKAIVMDKSSSIRLAVPTAVSISDKKEQKRVTELNAAQAIDLIADNKSKQNFQTYFNNYFEKENASLLLTNDLKPFAIFQRLLSPVAIIDSLGLSGSDNNTSMLALMRQTIDTEAKQKNINVFCPNWPINGAQDIANNPFEDPYNQATRNELGKFAASSIRTFKNKINFGVISPELSNTLTNTSKGKRYTYQELQQLNGKLKNATITIFNDPIKTQQFKLAFLALEQYEDIWQHYEAKQPINNLHDININLRMAALELVSGENLGIKVTSGCKSAKDRDAVLEMEATAIRQFFLNRGYLPNIENLDDVTKMAQYFAKAFISNYFQEIVSIYNSYGDSAIQDGKGVTAVLEKLGIGLSQMIPLIYMQEIGKELQQVQNNLQKQNIEKAQKIDFLTIGQSEIERQNKLSHSATWGKTKNTFKKLFAMIKEVFSNREVVALTTKDSLKVETDGDITLPVPELRIQDEELIYLNSETSDVPDNAKNNNNHVPVSFPNSIRITENHSSLNVSKNVFNEKKDNNSSSFISCFASFFPLIKFLQKPIPEQPTVLVTLSNPNINS